jgi:ABC-type antimicrobial peptide transport system permease subunit
MPAAADEMVLAPITAAALHAATGSVIPMTAGTGSQAMTVTGIGFVPSGPHNDYDYGAWLTSAGYDRVFLGAHYGFKFRIAALSLRPGADGQAVAARLIAKIAKIKGAGQVSVFPPTRLVQLQAIRDMAVLPLALSAFLAVLALGAVGHALSIAVRRRGHELAVLRALGLTRRQCRLVIVTQATLLAVIGLAFGIPLGLALGRVLWHAAADMAPVAYLSPVAVWALLAIAPATLIAALLLAGWPARRAARLHAGEILRTE